MMKENNNCCLFVILIWLLNIIIDSNVATSSVENIVDLKSRINRLTLAKIHSANQVVDLYVASTNHLYKIVDHDSTISNPESTTGLRIEIDLVTGPKLQKQQCAFITESIGSSNSGTQCIKYICGEDEQLQSNKLSNLAMNGGGGINKPKTGSIQQQNQHNHQQQRQLTDNDNRLLLIDERNEHLIECGTIDYGGCRLRRLSDLSIIGCNYSAPVIPFSSASGVVVSSSSSNFDDSSLYLMISNEYDPAERLDKTDFPIFSIRHLATTQSSHQTSLQMRQPLFQTKYPIESMNYDQTIFAPDFHMKIIYSFKHNGFIYFLFTITNKMLSESCNRVDADSSLSGSSSSSSSNQTASTKIVTRMLRICDSKWSANGSQQQQRLNRESTFNTQENLEQIQSLYASAASSATNSAMLTETVIDCDDSINNHKHHLLQSAHFHEMFSNSADDSMLFMTFNSSTNPTTSVVCRLTIKQIDAHFVSMLRKCLDGDNSYAELVSPYSNKYTWKTPCRCSVITDFSRKLPQSDVLNERKLFCHNDFFNYMNSRRTLTLKSIEIELPNTKPITSIVTMNVDNQENYSKFSQRQLVMILATLDAQIYMLNFDIDKNSAMIYDQISLASAKSTANAFASQISLSTSAALNINLVVSESVMLNVTRRTLYVTYDRYLYKINLQKCDQYRTCEMCLNGSQNSNKTGEVKENDHQSATTKTVPNPFCGWCMYEQKCSTRPECLKKSTSPTNSLYFQDQRSYADSLWLSNANSLETSQNRCPNILSVWPSRYVNPTTSSLVKPDNYVFEFNVKLIPNIEYYCDITTANLFQRVFSSQQQMTLNRVPANFLNETTLECDLMPIKAKFEQMTRSNPIRSKFANVSLQIRAATNSLYQNGPVKSTLLTTTLISTTNLYTFNCSYFTECSQCLSIQLGGSCVWCAKNSKCVFAKSSRLPSPLFLPLETNNYSELHSECPNEIEFYQRSANSRLDLMCTSLQWVQSLKKEAISIPKDLKRLEIAYSAESSLAQITNGLYRLAIQNPHRNYQLTFKCVFSKERTVSAEELHAIASSSYIEWLPEDSATPNMVPFDCKYAPYNDAKQLSTDLALQTVYLSVWWSSLPQSTGYHSKSLEGWNQVRFKSIVADNIISQEQEKFINLMAEQEDETSGVKSLDFIEISVINCKVKASSCGKCLDTQLLALGCGWCKTNSKCTMEKDCPVNIVDGRPGWMNGRNEFGSYCSHPRVINMKPRCGPKFSAGTRIVLNGENLGGMVKDVQVRMKPIVDLEKQKDSVSLNLDDLNCTVLEDLYIPASQIVCRTMSPMRSYEHIKEYSVYVVTKPSESLSFETDHTRKFSSLDDKNEFVYRYIEPEVISIEPRKGIKSGGTLIKIVGRNLACGSELTIKFISNSGLCEIVNITQKKELNRSYSVLEEDFKKENLDEIYCRTPAYNQNEWLMNVGQKTTLQTSLQFKLDDYVQIMNSSKFKFEYVDDPRILSIDPDSTIMSGGITMHVKGKGFDSIQTAHLILSTVTISGSYSRLATNEKSNTISNLNLFKSKCNIVNSSLIQCLLPSVKDQRFNLNTQSQAEPLIYYFYMQFNELTNKFASNQANLEQQQLKIYPDPQFEDGQIFSDKAPIILIRGENLLRGTRETDYQVLIGSSDLECNITSITMYFIACLLPSHEELVMNENHLIHSNHVTGRELKLSAGRLSGVGVGEDASVIKEPILSASSSSSKSYEVRVRIGESFSRTIGFIRYERESPISKYDVVEIKYIIVGACFLSLVLMITMLSCFVVLKRRQNKQIRQLKRMQTEFENLEMRVARECKEAFTELQMDIGELANTLNQTGAPFNDFQTYCVKILFPHASDTDKYYMTSMIDLRMSATNKENVKNGVLMFSQLILNKKFLLTFIHTLEADTHTFLLQDRVNLASYLSICLHDRLDYFTDILMTLLAELIEKLIDTKNNPKILMRRNESVAEKMLTNWFAFLLYDFIRDCAGTPLYILFLSIKQQIYKGPVDAITCEARYSLSEDKLIRQSIDYEMLTIRVQLQDFDDMTNEITVKVLNCDTITQVKEKILDCFFKGFPYSKRPHVDDLDLIFIPSEWNKNSRLILYDEDKTSKLDNDDYKRLNTLAHYKIPNGALFLLASRQSYQLIHSSANDACNSYTMLDSAKNAENMTLLSKSSKGSSSPPTYSKLSANELNQANSGGGAGGGGVYSAMNGSSVGLTESIFNTHPHHILHQQASASQQAPHHTSSSRQQQQTNQQPVSTTFSSSSKNASQKSKKYHLIKSNDMISNTTPNIKDDKHKQEIAAKLVSEVYLTRLLATKGGMQSYVDDFFESVFSTAHGSNVLPFAIKYLFDFLDEQANLHGINDPDVVYTWKSNSLPLRFWVNIIKNPDFVFDIHKSNIVDASLSVIASTFMDSCSQSKLDLNKESPSGKLLFYKEVHKYRKWVESYYSEIKQMPRFGEQDLNEMLSEESKKRYATFNKNNALYRLYNDYVKKYRVQIENALNNEYQDAASLSVNKHLNYRLQQVIYLMDAIEV